MARPSKLTKERQDAIVAALYRGATYEDASTLAGIDYTTFNLWRKRGEEEGKGKYFKFFNATMQAEALCRAELAECIKKAGVDKGDWRAASDYLERRDPSNWIKQNKLQVAGSVEITLKWDEGNDADADDTPAGDAPGAGADIPPSGTL